MKDKNKIIFLIIVLIIILVLGCLIYKKVFVQESEKPQPTNPIVLNDNEFNANIIKSVTQLEEPNKNFLISPYSIEIALNMLRDGANGETKTQIDNVINQRTINDLQIKNRINVANAAFIKNEYKKDVIEKYYRKIQNDYKGEILYDEYRTPKVINDWVNKETYGMIPTLIEHMDPNFALGIANAMAIDVDWANSFKCDFTGSEEFTKEDESKINVSMMHQNDVYAKYFDTEQEKGIVLPYKTYDENGEEVYDESDELSNLEFIGILPKDNITSYINSLTNETFTKIDTNIKEPSENEKINLSLPMFNYDYEINDFKQVLQNMGIVDVFDEDKADLSNMIVKKGANFYVSEAIHKTHIDLNEKGTKAAAVTAFIVNETTALPDKEKTIIEIKFNKPFAYMIRDSKTKEILFFGVVHEPSKWNGSTCSKE